MDEKLMRVMMYLPPHTARRISSLTERSPGVSGDVTEIRLHGGRPTALVISGRNVTDFAGECDVCTDAELSQTLARLTEDSVHTYGDTLRDGFVSLDGGYRIGVCGSANTSDGKIRGLFAVGTLTVRIPRAITGCDRELLGIILNDGAISSALIYSPPGVGKTTMIRALASSLSRGKFARRVSVIDTRREIYMKEMFGDSTADFFEGYPRGAGIEIATRTQNPEVIICDE
ncbi:MAG: AAA family ATPase, partial [Clostridia bacterium]|nr:AAA family ATPase [Clostridia bacterium]